MSPIRVVVSTVVLALVAASAFAAEAEIVEMPENIIAKLSRLKSKQLVGSDRDSDGGGRGRTGGAQCGALEVGNVNTGGKRTGAPRQVNVIVTGPVINANNKCK